MIRGLALQTDSPDPHIRGYGCYYHDVAAIVQDVFGRVLTPAELYEIFKSCHARGYILDNDLPTTGTKGDWYRAYVLDSIGVMRTVAAYLGGAIRAAELYRGPVRPAIPGTTHTIIEHYSGPGVHFRIGQVKPNLSVIIEYDPGPRFPTAGIRGVRHWRVVKA